MRPEHDIGLRQQISSIFTKERMRRTIDRFIPEIPIDENSEAIDAAREILKSNSLLVAMNHASYPDTFLATHSILSALKTDQTTAVSILVSEVLCRPESKNPKAKMTQTLGSLWDIEMLPVFLAKKGWTQSERITNNRKTITDTMKKLNQPNNIVIIFPEGNINHSLQEAERGLGEFITHTNGYTLPVTSNFHTYLYGPVLDKLPAPLKVHYPIWNKELAALVGKHNSKPASDFIMSTIASALPEHQRGFYLEISRHLENPNKMIEDSRVHAMRELYQDLFAYRYRHEEVEQEEPTLLFADESRY